MSTQVDLFTNVEPTSVSPAIAKPFVVCSAVNNTELLLSQPNESVNMIYSDILYGTGRNFGEYQDLKPIRSEIESHYVPRLIEMKRVLKQNGSIYLQMDTKINHWMRCLMDEVFGYENFRNEIVWCYSTSGANKSKFSEKHDVILYYAMCGATWNIYMDTKTSPLIAGRDRSIKTQNGRYENGVWVVDVFPKDWVEFKNVQSNRKDEYVKYPTQKPKELISRFVLASTNEGDTVADYYLGSGTTAVVCQELNRNFIGCDINEKAIEITKSRLLNGR